MIEILGDNKTPSLEKLEETIQQAVQKAIRRSARNNPPELVSKTTGEKNGDHQNSSPKKASQREQVLAILLKGDAAAKASGNGSLSFNQRSLYYVVREEVPGLEDGYFGALVTEYENKHGEIPRMFRNNRGAFYEPHGYGVTPLGTLTVRAYRRAPWIYGTVLVCEKEDNVHMLRESGFAERWDCFLLSSSGFTTRALKDLIDYIGETGRAEPVRIFAMIDADAHGSVIFQTLVQETKARGARNIEITNLGLFPWEGLADGLQYETGLIEQARKKGKYRRAKVADYILERDRQNLRGGNPNNEPLWETWLQDNRIELNAMTSPQRVAWVERKFSRAGVKKVIPPKQTALAELSKKVREEIASQVVAEALRDKHAWIDQETKKRFDNIALPTDITERIGKYLKSHRREPWTNAIDALVTNIAKAK
jgi:DNA topoisomerase 6 subunit A-like protein